MPELEKAVEYLKKAKKNISREPGKCQIYIERAIKEIEEYGDLDVPF